MMKDKYGWWKHAMIVFAVVVIAAGCASPRIGSTITPACFQVGLLQKPTLTESSGLARSSCSNDWFWTHNDSGDSPRIYMIDRYGADLGTFSVLGAQARDWEDITSVSLNGVFYVFAADVGDNDRKRKQCSLYGVREPCHMPSSAGERMLPLAFRIDYVYPDGAADCEAVAIDPRTYDFYMITKSQIGKCGVYRLPYKQWSEMLEQPVTVQHIATWPIRWITSFDFSPDGQRAVALTYDEAYEFSRAEGETWKEAFEGAPICIKLPKRRQGEAVCYDSTGKQLVLTSEQQPAPVWVVELNDVGAASTID